MRTLELIKGDISDLIRAGLQDGSAMDSNYDCFVAVQGTTIASEVTDKTDDNVYFLVQLEPADTALLRPGSYIMGIRITNDTLTPPFSREEQIRLDVIEQVVVD